MYKRLPDCARAKIFLFLSTPTADIIKQDIHRQYELYAPSTLSSVRAAA